MKQISKKQFTSGAFWKIAEAISSKGITMLVQLILARILMPEDYGVIALTAIFLNLSDILIDGGFSTTLIRKKDVDDCDYSCVLTVSLSIATVLYIIFFAVAPVVANYYEEPMFSPVLRVLGLTVFVQAFSATRTAVVNRNMQFKLLCYCHIAASVISGIVGIVCAYKGFGVWAIVVQRLMHNLLVTGLLFIMVKFRIKWQVSLERMKEILNFSAGVVSASLLYFVTNNLYSAVIGKRYSVTDLGYYSKGNQLPEQFSLYTFSAVSGVLLPTISSYQDDIERVKHIIRKVTAFSTYVIFPLMIGMMLTSEELIVLLLSEKWRASAPIMIGCCIYYLGMPFTLMNAQVYYAMGHSFLKLKVEIIRFVITTLGLVIGSFILKCTLVQLSIIGGSLMVVTAIISAYEAGKILDYTFKEMFADIIKPIICTSVMAATVWIAGWALSRHGFSGIVIPLIVKVFVGVLVYIMGSLLTKADGFNEVKDILLGVLKKKKKEGT